MTRLSNRIGVRTTIVGSLLLIALFLTLAAGQGLAAADSRRVDDRLDAMASELSTTASTATSEDALANLIQALALRDGVRTITVLDAGSGRVVAAASDERVESRAAVLDAGLPTAGAELPAGGASTRYAELAAPDSAVPSGELVMVIEFDRGEVGNDLAMGRIQATVGMFGVTATLLIAAYLLVGTLVTQRLDRVISRARDLAGMPDSHAGGDEITAVERATAQLVEAAGRSPQRTVAVASRLPAMWIQLDPGLQIVDSRVESEGGRRGPVTLNVQQLDELLSDTVVNHIRMTMPQLEPGDVEMFDFAVGHREYRGELACHDVETFELAIVESEPAADTVQVRDRLPGEEALDRLLGELPFTLLELDARGRIQWANAPYLGQEPEALTGRALVDVLPDDVRSAGREALRSALSSEHPAHFNVQTDVDGAVGRWNHTAVSYKSGSTERLLVAAIEIPVVEQPQVDQEATRRLEEQLWNAELRISDMESQLEQLGAQLVAAERGRQDTGAAIEDLRAAFVDPMRAVVRASLGLVAGELPASARPQADALRSTVEQLAATFDAHFGTTLAQTMDTGIDVVEERFHVATFLDEIAIDMSRDLPGRESRIGVRVQPSLPRWLHGDIAATRAAIYQMIEIARLVVSDRPLVLGARQDTSTGRSVQVRFEVEIPPPALDEGALDVVRGCLAGDTEGLTGSLSGLAEFNPLDIELVTVEGQATILRCSNAFDVADEPETDHSWVRGLRTLIVQAPQATDNGVQAALGAFGIIGYVVSDEKDLIEALRMAEEYSNPYRFVLADVDTPNLESFIGQLFDGDAPVVLVGKESESAMVGALSAGYDGYLAKPVRQVDLLEVILSTVEPPAQHQSALSPASVA